MPSSGLWCRVGLARTEVSEESVALIFRVERISKLGTLAVTTDRLLINANVPSSLITSRLKMKATRSSEKSILTNPTRATAQKTAIFIVAAVNPQILPSINRLRPVAET
jgi:hypothetical protein